MATPKDLRAAAIANVCATWNATRESTSERLDREQVQVNPNYVSQLTDDQLDEHFDLKRRTEHQSEQCFFVDVNGSILQLHGTTAAFSFGLHI